MAAHACLKNEFTEDEKYHYLTRWLKLSIRDESHLTFFFFQTTFILAHFFICYLTCSVCKGDEIGHTSSCEKLGLLSESPLVTPDKY